LKLRVFIEVKEIAGTEQDKRDLHRENGKWGSVRWDKKKEMKLKFLEGPMKINHGNT